MPPKSTIVEIKTGLNISNPGVWDWETFSVLLAFDDLPSREISKALCWNVFNAAEELVRTIEKALDEKKLIDAGEAAKTFATRTSALGTPRLTKSLLQFHRFCVTNVSVEVPAQPPVESTVDAASKRAPKKDADDDMAALSDEEEEKVGTKDKKKKDAAPRLTRTEFNAQFDKNIAAANVLFNVIKDEANEAEEWILRFYEEKPLRDQDKVVE